MVHFKNQKCIGADYFGDLEFSSQVCFGQGLDKLDN